MSKSRARLLQEQSLQMAVAAIEIYNKPNFPSRDLIFPILMVNAWESLAKAKLLKDNNNRMTCLYVKDRKTNRYKRTKSGEYMTIGAATALHRCDPPPVVSANVGHLIDIRDIATHLPKHSDARPLVLFNLGSATLKSYAILIQDWFGVTLSKYNSYILPLGFSHPFTTISTIDLTKEPKSIARIVREIAANQALNLDERGHHLVCEIHAELISAKRLSGAPGITASVGTDGNAVFLERKVDLHSQYPLSWEEALNEVKFGAPNVKSNTFSAFIKERKIKGDPRYSSYSYLTRRSERRGPNRNTTVIYNHDLVRLCVDALKS